MKKRYQVFVSSTYEDLREERSKVMQKLLEMDCIPAGMELFPAADDDAWTLIQNVIDECDYYILILAGRYGSTDENGLGFTEKEYRYAVEKGKPIVAFLHSSPGKLVADNCEKTEKGKKRLQAFRNLAKKKFCKLWGNADELAAAVTVGMVHMMRRNPGIGWIRANQIPPDDILLETIRLQKRVVELEQNLKEYEDGPPPGTTNLAQGKDRIRLTFNHTRGAAISIETDWDTIIDAIARDLLRSGFENHIAATLVTALRDSIDSLRDFSLNPTPAGYVYLSSESREVIRIQLRALGLASQKLEWWDDDQTGQSESDFKWTLTPFGDRFVAQRLAIRRSVGNE